ncbi:MAG TPA: carboxymuconolactone decarboxylase family protein [Terriglobia bacterium]|nr:carboxymuconolactone decarboxylase family protein [Terriglobia bacterium]
MSEKGLEMLQRMLGESRAREVRAAWEKLSPDFAHYVTDFLAGDIWARPGLDLKTRSLITVAAMTALGRPNGLRLNIEMALNNGVTEQEILEALLHMAPYAGFPACWEGLLIADEVFKQRQPQKGS